MLKLVFSVFGVALAVTPVTAAPQETNAALLNQGEQIYQDNCALCHQVSGTGSPPTFPALNGNALLGNAARIVRSIQQGTDQMPPFPHLTIEEISAVTSYIRNAWQNTWDDVDIEEVALTLEDSTASDQMTSVWDTVFTEEQANRGQAVYQGACGLCHGRRLNGAPDDPDMSSTPPLARARFLRIWGGRSLATLFSYIRATMPESNPNSLTEQEYTDVIAYMLSVGGMPTGNEELPTDLQQLAHMFIQPRP